MMNYVPPPSKSDIAVPMETIHWYVDESGDPTLFAKRGMPIVETEGCSRYFMLGMLEVEDPAGLAAELDGLRGRLLSHPYFKNVPSFDPKKGRTAIAFHAKDDLAEVRFQVFDLLVAQGSKLRFHAVVCDKLAILQEVQGSNQTDSGYRYSPNELYDRLMHSLFRKLHRLADRYEICIARRGKHDRNEALRLALEKAEQDFVSTYGFSRGSRDDWRIRVSTPKTDVPLQAVDYFLWALQRFYIPHRDKADQLLPRESRYLDLLWPQTVEIHDMHFGPSRGTFFNNKKPLTIESRFGEEGKKRKK